MIPFLFVVFDEPDGRAGLVVNFLESSPYSHLIIFHRRAHLGRLLRLGLCPIALYQAI